MTQLRGLAGLVLFLSTSQLPAQPPPLGLRVPPGFEVTEYADEKLANDIFSMTVDAKGRIVVSGRGYIRILVDDNRDGRADRAIAFRARRVVCERETQAASLRLQKRL